MDRNMLPPSIGTQLKLAVSADLGEAHMSEVDFECSFFACGGSSGQTIGKDKMTYVNDDEYIAIVDTSKVGRGEYMMRLRAWVPDPDMEDGLRVEVVTVGTGVKVVA